MSGRLGQHWTQPGECGERRRSSARRGAATTLELPTLPAVGAVATALGSQCGSRIPPERLVSMVQRYDSGIRLVGLADTLGTANPQQVVESVGAGKDALADIDRAPPARPVRRSEADCRCRLRPRRAPLRQRPGRLRALPGDPREPHGDMASESIARHLRRRGIDTGLDEDAPDEAIQLLPPGRADRNQPINRRTFKGDRRR